MKKSEWIFLTAVLMLIGTFYFLSKMTSDRYLNRTEAPLDPIRVEVIGCVRRERVFEVLPGTLTRAVLRKAGVQPLADLAAIDFDQPIEASCQIYIPKLQHIEIKVEGCVAEKISLQMPIGSRVCDLKEMVFTTPEADLTFFKRRRRLKNHEVICVPARS